MLGLGTYKTAWTWVHKLRRAMVRLGRDRLSGRVEVDETYLGALEEGVRGCQTDAKALIVGSHRGNWRRHRADSDAARLRTPLGTAA